MRVEHEPLEVAPRIDALLVDGRDGACDAVEDAEVAVEASALLIEVADTNAATETDRTVERERSTEAPRARRRRRRRCLCRRARENGPEQRRLSGAVRPEDAEALARRH